MSTSYAEAQSSVIFSRFQTTTDLPLSKLGEKSVHQHDLCFAQQVAARVLAPGDPINPYLVAMGDADCSGNLRSAHLTTGVYDDACGSPLPYLAASNQATAGATLVLGNASAKGFSTQVAADALNVAQIGWSNSSDNIDGVFQGRHCLKMSEFLNVFYQGNSNKAGVTPIITNKLDRAKLIDRYNQSIKGPVGWFGVDTSNKMRVGGAAVTVLNAGVAQEAKGVVLTQLSSNGRNCLGFNVQHQVMTNILTDLGVDVKAENASAGKQAADKLDSTSYIKLANFLGKHDNLGEVVSTSTVSPNESMTKSKLFYELAKQYDSNNLVYTSDPVKQTVYNGATPGVSVPLTSCSKAVNTWLQNEKHDETTRNSKAEGVLASIYSDRSANESGRVAVAFLYKSQTPGVKSTEIRVHMKISGGQVTDNHGGHEGVYPKYVKTADDIGRSWEQMCTPLPLMEEGIHEPVGVAVPDENTLDGSA